MCCWNIEKPIKVDECVLWNFERIYTDFINKYFVYKEVYFLHKRTILCIFLFLSFYRKEYASDSYNRT